MEQKKKLRWRLRIADNLDNHDAVMIGEFASRFAPPGVDSDARRSHSGAYYLWKLQRNSAGRGFVSLAMDGDRLVGTATVTRKKMRFNGQIIEAAEIGDTFTDPEFQRQGIFSTLVTATRDRAVASGVRLIYGTPNINSLPGYEKNLSFRRKLGLNLRLCVFPLRPAAMANARLAGRNIKLPERFLDAIATSYLNLTTSFLAGSCREEALSFGEEFDEFDNQFYNRREACVPRTAAYLTFRLMENPDSVRYRIISSRDRIGKLEGFVILKEVIQQGLRVLWVADVAAKSSMVAMGLWSAALRFGVSRKQHLVASWLPLQLGTYFLQLPWAPIPVQAVPVILYDHDLGSVALSSDLAFRFSVLDSDNI
jgi:GNAT superfamily N-acetyltransferase